jgi:hypothetical protein
MQRLESAAAELGLSQFVDFGRVRRHAQSAVMHRL